MVKSPLRPKAISLRKNGLSYSEIMDLLPISKASLSSWLSEIRLSEIQIKRLKQKGLVGAAKGAIKRHENRLNACLEISQTAEKEIGTISLRELWLIGIALYWAEGSKQKENNPSQGLLFSNSDPKMIKVFLMWINKILDIESENLIFEIYVHQSHSGHIKAIQQHWEEILGVPEVQSARIYLKDHPRSALEHKNEKYFGLMRIKVRSSTNLNRKVSGWINGIHWGIV